MQFEWFSYWFILMPPWSVVASVWASTARAHTPKVSGWMMRLNLLSWMFVVNRKTISRLWNGNWNVAHRFMFLWLNLKWQEAETLQLLEEPLLKWIKRFITVIHVWMLRKDQSGTDPHPHLYIRSLKRRSNCFISGFWIFIPPFSPLAAANQEEAWRELLRHQQHRDPHVCGCHHQGGEAAIQRDSHTQVGANPPPWSAPSTCCFIRTKLSWLLFCQLALGGHFLTIHNWGGERARGKAPFSL